MIVYIDNLDSIKPEDLTGFFTGWKNKPDLEKFFKILENSSHIVLAIDSHSRKVAGFITSLTDGLFSAYIPLLEVRTAYQKQGIGNELLKGMLEKLSDLYMIDLICDGDLVSYYQKSGFQKTQGMSIRHYDKIIT